MTPGATTNAREAISSSLCGWITESLDRFGVDSRVFLRVIQSILEQDVHSLKEESAYDELWKCRLTPVGARKGSRDVKKPSNKEDLRRVVLLENMKPCFKEDESDFAEEFVDELLHRWSEEMRIRAETCRDVKNGNQCLPDDAEAEGDGERRDPITEYCEAFPALVTAAGKLPDCWIAHDSVDSTLKDRKVAELQTLRNTHAEIRSSRIDRSAMCYSRPMQRSFKGRQHVASDRGVFRFAAISGHCDANSNILNCASTKGGMLGSRGQKGEVKYQGSSVNESKRNDILEGCDKSFTQLPVEFLHRTIGKIISQGLGSNSSQDNVGAHLTSVDTSNDVSRRRILEYGRRRKLPIYMENEFGVLICLNDNNKLHVGCKSAGAKVGASEGSPVTCGLKVGRRNDGSEPAALQDHDRQRLKTRDTVPLRWRNSGFYQNQDQNFSGAQRISRLGFDKRELHMGSYEKGVQNNYTRFERAVACRTSASRSLEIAEANARNTLKQNERDLRYESLGIKGSEYDERRRIDTGDDLCLNPDGFHVFCLETTSEAYGGNVAMSYDVLDAPIGSADCEPSGPVKTLESLESTNASKVITGKNLAVDFSLGAFGIIPYHGRCHKAFLPTCCATEPSESFLLMESIARLAAEINERDLMNHVAKSLMPLFPDLLKLPPLYLPESEILAYNAFQNYFFGGVEGVNFNTGSCEEDYWLYLYLALGAVDVSVDHVLNFDDFCRWRSCILKQAVAKEKEACICGLCARDLRSLTNSDFDGKLKASQDVKSRVHVEDEPEFHCHGDSDSRLSPDAAALTDCGSSSGSAKGADLQAVVLNNDASEAGNGHEFSCFGLDLSQFQNESIDFDWSSLKDLWSDDKALLSKDRSAGYFAKDSVEENNNNSKAFNSFPTLFLPLGKCMLLGSNCEGVWASSNQTMTALSSGVIGIDCQSSTENYAFDEMLSSSGENSPSGLELKSVISSSVMFDRLLSSEEDVASSEGFQMALQEDFYSLWLSSSCQNCEACLGVWCESPVGSTTETSGSPSLKSDDAVQFLSVSGSADDPVISLGFSQEDNYAQGETDGKKSENVLEDGIPRETRCHCVLDPLVDTAADEIQYFVDYSLLQVPSEPSSSTSADDEEDADLNTSDSPLSQLSSCLPDDLDSDDSDSSSSESVSCESASAHNQVEIAEEFLSLLSDSDSSRQDFESLNGGVSCEEEHIATAVFEDLQMTVWDEVGTSCSQTPDLQKSSFQVYNSSSGILGKVPSSLENQVGSEFVNSVDSPICSIVFESSVCSSEHQESNLEVLVSCCMTDVSKREENTLENAEKDKHMRNWSPCDLSPLGRVVLSESVGADVDAVNLDGLKALWGVKETEISGGQQSLGELEARESEKFRNLKSIWDAHDQKSRNPEGYGSLQALQEVSSENSHLVVATSENYLQQSVSHKLVEQAQGSDTHLESGEDSFGIIQNSVWKNCEQNLGWKNTTWDNVRPEQRGVKLDSELSHAELTNHSDWTNDPDYLAGLKPDNLNQRKAFRQRTQSDLSDLIGDKTSLKEMPSIWTNQESGIGSYKCETSIVEIKPPCNTSFSQESSCAAEQTSILEVVSSNIFARNPSLAGAKVNRCDKLKSNVSNSKESKFSKDLQFVSTEEGRNCTGRLLSSSSENSMMTSSASCPNLKPGFLKRRVGDVNIEEQTDSENIKELASIWERKEARMANSKAVFATKNLESCVVHSSSTALNCESDTCNEEMSVQNGPESFQSLRQIWEKESPSSESKTWSAPLWELQVSDQENCRDSFDAGNTEALASGWDGKEGSLENMNNLASCSSQAGAIADNLNQLLSCDDLNTASVNDSPAPKDVWCEERRNLVNANGSPLSSSDMRHEQENLEQMGLNLGCGDEICLKTERLWDNGYQNVGSSEDLNLQEEMLEGFPCLTPGLGVKNRDVGIELEKIKSLWNEQETCANSCQNRCDSDERSDDLTKPAWEIGLEDISEPESFDEPVSLREGFAPKQDTLNWVKLVSLWEQEGLESQNVTQHQGETVWEQSYLAPESTKRVELASYWERQDSLPENFKKTEVGPCWEQKVAVSENLKQVTSGYCWEPQNAVADSLKRIESRSCWKPEDFASENCQQDASRPRVAEADPVLESFKQLDPESYWETQDSVSTSLKRVQSGSCWSQQDSDCLTDSLKRVESGFGWEQEDPVSESLRRVASGSSWGHQNSMSESRRKVSSSSIWGPPQTESEHLKSATPQHCWQVQSTTSELVLSSASNCPGANSVLDSSEAIGQEPMVSESFKDLKSIWMEPTQPVSHVNELLVAGRLVRPEFKTDCSYFLTSGLGEDQQNSRCLQVLTLDYKRHLALEKLTVGNISVKDSHKMTTGSDRVSGNVGYIQPDASEMSWAGPRSNFFSELDSDLDLWQSESGKLECLILGHEHLESKGFKGLLTDVEIGRHNLAREWQLAEEYSLKRTNDATTDEGLWHLVYQNPDNAPKLVPSENTAFRDKIPHRFVCRYSFFDPLDASCQHLVAKDARTETIRHIYDPGNSIVRQLEDIFDDGQHLHVEEALKSLPNYMFRPIGAQNSGRDSYHSNGTSLTDISELILQIKTPASDPMEILEPESPYQLYLGVESETFVPRFRVHKEMEKSAQTGESTPPMQNSDAVCGMNVILSTMALLD